MNDTDNIKELLTKGRRHAALSFDGPLLHELCDKLEAHAAELLLWKLHSREQRLVIEQAKARFDESEAKCAKVTEAARYVLYEFKQREAVGYQSRDRVFAIEILDKALAEESRQ